MTGLLVLSQPGLAHAAANANAKADEGVKTTVLHPTVSNTDGTVRYSLAGLAGGGVQVSFVLVPDEASGETSGEEKPQHQDFTLTVDAKALATQTVVDDGDDVVPAAAKNATENSTKDGATDEEDGTRPSGEAGVDEAGGAIVKQDASSDSTTVTLQASTKGQQTVWVLPEQAPAAVDPDDQGWVTRTWHALLSKISGGEDSPTGDGGDDAGQDEGTPSAEPTGSPSSTSTSSPSSTSTSSPSSTTAPDTCDLPQVTPQLTTSTADDGTVNAPLEDGPTSAPTFSDEVRKKAAQVGPDCADDPTSSAGQDDAGQDEGDAASPTKGSTSSSGKTKVNLKTGDWLSGISGERPEVEKLRGVDAEVATTWADASGGVNQLDRGAEFGADQWDKSLIIGIPPFPEGSSWEDTAAGKNDDYLRTTFSTMKTKWAGRNGQAFVEYGWEMNGSWMWWSAKAGQEDAVGKAFARARSIQQAEFPEALLGVRFNHESNGYDGDSKDLIAAAKPSIDFIGASYYNAYPPVATAEEFAARATMRDGGGGPKGIATWLQAAKTAGLPIEFGEWAESAKDGDSPAFIDGMHQVFSENAGPGAGQVFAESYFQINKDGDNWRLNSGRVPQSEAAYAKAFSDVG